MAKILKEKPWRWVFECRNCQTKIEAGIDDVECAYFSDELEYYVVCPVCGTNNLSGWKVSIPPKAQEGAKTRLKTRREATAKES
jgi:hypothetical protein